MTNIEQATAEEFNVSGVDNTAIEMRFERLESELRDLRDRRDIERLLFDYCRAADRLDKDLLRSCYHSDGVDNHWFFTGLGWDFADYIIPVLSECVMSEHALSNIMIDLDGDRAFCESRWQVVHQLPTSTGLLMDQLIHGRYLDVLERRDGRWGLTYRHVVQDAFRDFSTPDMQAVAELAYEGISGRHGTDDPVYAGFDIQKLRPQPNRDKDFWAQFYQMHGSQPRGSGRGRGVADRVIGAVSRRVVRALAR